MPWNFTRRMSEKEIEEHSKKFAILIIISIICAFIVGSLNYEKYAKQMALKEAEPYLAKLTLQDAKLRELAAAIVAGCPFNDKECQVNELYRFLVENFRYYADPRKGEYVQNPFETLKLRGGDCEDLTILAESMLENIGFKTYLVITKTHVFTLVCGLDRERLWSHIEENIKEKVGEMLQEEGKKSVLFINNELYIAERINETILVKNGKIARYGGDGTPLKPPLTVMNIKYDINSSAPVSIYILSTKDSFNKLVSDMNLPYADTSECVKKDVFATSGMCRGLRSYGIVAIVNNSGKDAKVNVQIDFLAKYSLPKTINNRKIAYYRINGDECIAFDVSAGPSGYVGYTIAKKDEQKIAIDPLTKKLFFIHEINK